jgi:uncharacterized SAM-binding protein YcdF (DUF218 family)
MVTKFCRGLLVIIASSILIWLVGFVRFIHFIPHTVADTYTKTDAIVVLTGGQGRLHEGVSLLEAKKAQKMLVSGVGQHASLAELALTTDGINLAQLQPLKDRITLGYLASDTEGNAKEAALWLALNHCQSVRLVTSNYHIDRSMLEFAYEMPNITIIPHPVNSGNVKLKEWWKFRGTAMLLFSEYNKIIIIKIKRWWQTLTK